MVSFNEKLMSDIHICFAKSSYSESNFVVVLLFFGWKEGKHSGKCSRVHCGRVEQEKEQEGFSTYA